MGELLELAARYRVRPVMAAGGQLALSEARHPDVALVIAIACFKELREGILAAWPKPVWAVPLRSSHQPCRDSLIPLTEVEASLKLWST